MRRKGSSGEGMMKNSEIAIAKYEILVRNIEFLDGWVMKVTAIFGLFVVAIISNLDKILLIDNSYKVWMAGLAAFVGVIFCALLWRIHVLMKESMNTLFNLEIHFGELAKERAIDSRWGTGITTTLLCGVLVSVVTVFMCSMLVVMQ